MAVSLPGDAVRPAAPSPTSTTATTPTARQQFETLRAFMAELNLLLLRLDGVCSCAQMTSAQWVYLCAAHRSAKDCSAMDYCLHLLEGTSALIGNHELFPPRGPIPGSSLQYLNSASRRLYRILAHAYFSHRDVWARVEAESQLTQRFSAFVLDTRLVPRKLLVIEADQQLQQNS